MKLIDILKEVDLEIPHNYVNGEVYFSGRDVCHVLGYVNASSAITAHVSEANKVHATYKDMKDLGFTSGTKGHTLLTEYGVFELIQRSQLVLAYKLRKWVPVKTAKEIMAHPNRKTVDLTFGEAVVYMREGTPVARKGWNGSGMFVYLVPGGYYPARTEAAKRFFGENGIVPYREYLALKTAQGDVATWAPSCSDALANDWQVVDLDLIKAVIKESKNA